MIGVAVAEDEGVLPVGRVPVHHPHALPAANLAGHPLRHIDAVVEDRGIEAFLREQGLHAVQGQQRRLEVAGQDQVGTGL